MKTDGTEFAIEAEDVRRSFDGVTALDGLTLRVPCGSIYGFLGRNGAGKTTAIKIIAGLLWPDHGRVRVLGKAPQELTAEDRQRIGYVSEKQILPAHLRVRSVLRFTAGLYPRWDTALADRLLATFRIDRNRRVAALSQGAQRQVAFILALAQRPDLLILDEPASTLDVLARREFLDEILGLLRQGGPTVFLSSHILSDIERVADQVGILAQGRLKVSEPLDALKESVKLVRFFNARSEAALPPVPGALRVTRSNREAVVVLRSRDEGLPARVAEAWRAEYEVQGLSLEDIFVEISQSQNL